MVWERGRLVLYGSVMHLLCHYVMPDTPEQNLAKIWTTSKMLYRQMGVPKENRYGTMKLTMFKLGGTTKLRGKAGEIRSFGQVLSRLFDMYSNQHLELHQKMSLCLKLGVRMEKILDEHPEDFALPGVHVFGVRVCVYSCLIVVLWLSYSVFDMCLMVVS